MKIHLQILEDNGEVLSDHWADASTPSSWNVPTGQRFVSKMPQNSDNENTGTYELFRITVQPHVRVDKPNGWKPAASPLNGQSFTPPWSTSAPTQSENRALPPALIPRG